MRFNASVPLWLWLIVLGGLAYGLVEVGLRERRAARRRVRQMRADAHRRVFSHHADEQHHQITALLVLVPDLGTTRSVGPVFDGQLLDGTPLTNLAGYTVKYGKQSGVWDQTMQVNDPAATGFTVENLTPGTWYFAVTARNTEGAESAPSSPR